MNTRESPHPSRRLNTLIVGVLWAFCVLRGIMYVSVNPAFEGFDEPQHYGYIQEICEQGRFPVFHKSRLSLELKEAISCLPMAISEDPDPTHENFWSRSPEERAKLRKALVDIPREYRKEESSIDQYQYQHPIQSQHPPLYYLLCSPIYFLMQERGVIDILFAIRLFSVLLASLTIPLGYFALKSWFPKHTYVALVSVAIVVFMPVFYFDTARVGNDSLGVPLFTGLLWACGIYWRGERKIHDSMLVGAMLGLGLLTKTYFLAALPPILLMFLFKWILQKNRVRSLLYHLAVLIFFSLSIGGWWFIRNYILYDVFSGLQESVYSQDSLSNSWISALNEISLSRFFRRIIDTHLWPGNWSFLDLPKSVERIYRFILTVGLAAFLVRAIVELSNGFKKRNNLASIIIVLFYFTFLAAMLYHSLQAWGLMGHIMTGGWYLCALIVIETAMLLLGYIFILPNRLKFLRMDLALLSFYMAVDFLGFFRMIPFYTGFASKAEHHGLIYGSIPSDLTELTNTMLTRIAWNKPPWITQYFLIAVILLCALAAISTLILFLVITPTRYHKISLLSKTFDALPMEQPSVTSKPTLARISSRKFAALILTASLLQGVLWAVITPPLQAPDEQAHFGYVQHLWEQQSLSPPGSRGQLSKEIVDACLILKMDKIKFNEVSNFTFSKEEEELTQQKIDKMTWSDRIIPGGMRNPAGHYPPLYYLLGSLGYWTFYDGNIVHRIFGVRLVSVLLTSITVLLTYVMANKFFEGDEICARTASCLMLFHPMLAFIGSSVNCDALLFLVSTLTIFLLILMIKNGLNWKYQVGLCACIFVGFLTKPTFAAMIPLWILAVFMSGKKDGLLTIKNISHMIFILVFLTAAYLLYLYFGDQHLKMWSYAFKIGHVNDSRSFFHYMCITFLNLIRPWTLMGKRLITTYWANFGWKDTAFPFYGIYLVAHFIMLTTIIYVSIKVIKNKEPWHSGRNGLLSFAVLGFIIFNIGIIIMGYTIVHEAWGSGNLQGRYLFPTLALNVFVITAGLIHFIKDSKRKRHYASIIVGAMVLWHLASFMLVFERFYL